MEVMECYETLLRWSDVKVMNEEILDRMDKSDLDKLTTMLCLAPDNADFELSLLKRLPNLKKCFFVEGDVRRFNSVMLNWTTTPACDGTEVSVYNRDLIEWKTDLKWDVVVLGRCFFSLQVSERKELLEKCFGKWMNSDALLLLKVPHLSLNETTQSTLIGELFRHLGKEVNWDLKSIKEDISILGKCMHKELEAVVKVNMEEAMKEVSGVKGLQFENGTSHECLLVVKS